MSEHNTGGVERDQVFAKRRHFTYETITGGFQVHVSTPGTSDDVPLVYGRYTAVRTYVECGLYFHSVRFTQSNMWS